MTSRQEAGHPTRVRFKVLGAGCFLAVITYIHRVGFATASAELKGPLGLSDSHLGWLMAAFMIGYGLFEMPWGYLGDRLGVRNILAAIILGGSTLTAALVLVVLLPQNVAWIVGFLLVVRFLFGVFQAGTFPVDLADDLRLDPDQRARRRPGTALDVEPGRRGHGAVISWSG